MDGFLLAESKASKNEVEAALNDARKLKFQNAKVTLFTRFKSTRANSLWWWWCRRDFFLQV